LLPRSGRKPRQSEDGRIKNDSAEKFGWRFGSAFARKGKSFMGSIKKRRKAKINKHKRRKKLRLNRHKKRTWQK
jgi:hypothetical protein